MTLEDLTKLASALQSFATIISMSIGGIWVYRRFIRQQEKYPNVEFLSDINFVGFKDNWWIAEIIATIDNKGKAQHRMNDISFDLNAMYDEDPVDVSERWGNQINFPHSIAEGTFLPQKSQFFFIDPGTKAKYSFITKIPKEAKFVILHCRFKYGDKRNYSHASEKTVAVPCHKELLITKE